MSRLQVGGLALIIGFDFCEHNLGKVVQLDEYIGEAKYSNGHTGTDMWSVSGDLKDSKLKNTSNMHCESKYLMPLGDKQTQNELAKEKEREFT